jgi:putative ABC transport system ATP-binding protein
MEKQIIQLNNISRNFGEVKALQEINLSIESGQWVAIMGPSGSGKSTLLNLLSCLDSPTSGSYILEDCDISHFDEKALARLRREKIGLIFQQFHLFPYLTTLENVLVSQYLHSQIDRQDAEAVLRQVGLAHRFNHLPSQLSGGEKQRVCIARALINQPNLILADEPTGNLDKNNELNVIELFQNIHKSGRTIIMVTHNPKIAEFADRVILIEHGKIVEALS